jgi:hypothetical protein
VLYYPQAGFVVKENIAVQRSRVLGSRLSPPRISGSNSAFRVHPDL